MNRDPQAHLTEEEFREFFFEELPEADQAELDAHVQGCESCARELEGYQHAYDSFPEKEWEARRPALIASLRLSQFLQRVRERMSSAWEQFRSLAALPGAVGAAGDTAMAHAASAVELVDDVSPDGGFGFSAQVDHDTRSLIMRFDCRAMEYKGWVVVVGDKRWSRRSQPLQSVTEGSIGAEIVFAADERDNIPPWTELNISVVSPTGELLQGSAAARPVES